MSIFDYIEKLLEQTKNLDRRLREVEIKLSKDPFQDKGEKHVD